MTLRIEIIPSEEQREEKDWRVGGVEEMNKISGLCGAVSCVIGDLEDVATKTVKEKIYEEIKAPNLPK